MRSDLLRQHGNHHKGGLTIRRSSLNHLTPATATIWSSGLRFAMTPAQERVKVRVELEAVAPSCDALPIQPPTRPSRAVAAPRSRAPPGTSLSIPQLLGGGIRVDSWPGVEILDQ